MNALYNKILKEALDLMDFDSWDDSQQPFQDVISNNLKQIFIYKTGPSYNINSTDSCIRIFYGFSSISGSEPEWPLFSNYKDKVYINGEHVKLKYSGETEDEFPEGEYKIYIDDLSGIETCFRMFWCCKQLISVPFFDTSKCTNMKMMFSNCENLLKVPEFDTRNVENMTYMFFNCQNIESIPLFNLKKINKIGNGGCAIFNYCFKLNNETKKAWDKVYNFRVGRIIE